MKTKTSKKDSPSKSSRALKATIRGNTDRPAGHRVRAFQTDSAPWVQATMNGLSTIIVTTKKADSVPKVSATDSSVTTVPGKTITAAINRVSNNKDTVRVTTKRATDVSLADTSSANSKGTGRAPTTMVDTSSKAVTNHANNKVIGRVPTTTAATTNSRADISSKEAISNEAADTNRGSRAVVISPVSKADSTEDVDRKVEDTVNAQATMTHMRSTA